MCPLDRNYSDADNSTILMVEERATMTPSLPPSVLDPVQPDVDDLVIKQARRRTRRRRWDYRGIGAAVAAVLGVAAACGPRYAGSTNLSTTPAPVSALATAQFLSLPPEEGVPSTPTTGDLVAVIPTEHTRVWVYGDGRLITMHMFPFTENAWPNSGFVIQHLIPAGVEMLRSYVADSIGARNLIPIDEADPGVGARTLCGFWWTARCIGVRTAAWRLTGGAVPGEGVSSMSPVWIPDCRHRRGPTRTTNGMCRAGT